jgi:hypothetical protein
MEYLKVQNNNLKKEIDLINSKIYESLENFKNTKKENLMNTRLINYNFNNFSSEREELSTLQQKIDFYKDAIQKIKNQMEGIFNIKK